VAGLERILTSPFIGDPSFRLESGYAQDDAISNINERKNLERHGI
jgi:hypothetical protein